MIASLLPTPTAKSDPCSRVRAPYRIVPCSSSRDQVQDDSCAHPQPDAIVIDQTPECGGEPISAVRIRCDHDYRLKKRAVLSADLRGARLNPWVFCIWRTIARAGSAGTFAGSGFRRISRTRAALHGRVNRLYAYEQPSTIAATSPRHTYTIAAMISYPVRRWRAGQHRDSLLRALVRGARRAAVRPARDGRRHDMTVDVRSARRRYRGLAKLLYTSARAPHPAVGSCMVANPHHRM